MLGSSVLVVGEPPSRSRGASRYRPEIDGLRAFAVIAVIINHFNKNALPSGYLGVDIFFVISGFVITSSLLRRESKNFGDFLAGFYERRIKRLVPALVVFVLATSLLICLFNPEPGPALGLGWRSLFGISNIQLYRESTNYFAESTDLNPYVHTWSLGVEEQFYLLFPFLVWFSGFGRQTARGARNLFWMVGTLSIASGIGYIYLSQVNQPASYFLMPPRFWEMAAGCLVFLALHRRAWIGDLLQKIPTTLIAIGMIGIMFLPVSLAVPATFSIVLLTGLLIGSLRTGSVAFKFLTLEKVVYIGLISYSLYLWHWGVLSISLWTIGIHWWSVPIQFAVMFVLAFGSYRFLETPLRKGKWVKRRELNIGTGLAVLGLSSTLLIYSSRLFAKYLFVGNSERGHDIYSERKLWQIEKCGNDRKSTYLPSESDFDECWISKQRKASDAHDNEQHVFAIGNSYNMQLVPLYSELSEGSNLKFNAYYSSACPASATLATTSENIHGHCSRVFSRYINWALKSAKKDDFIIIAKSLDMFTGESKRSGLLTLDGKQLGPQQAYKLYVMELKHLSYIARAKNINLIVTSGIPVLKSNPDICSQWYASLNNDCHEFLDFKTSALIKKVGLDFSKDISSHARFVDIFDPIYNHILIAKDYSLYFDLSHLSRNGTKLLRSRFKQAFAGSRI